jgi:hypothetical protein
MAEMTTTAAGAAYRDRYMGLVCFASVEILIGGALALQLLVMAMHDGRQSTVPHGPEDGPVVHARSRQRTDRLI